VSLKLTHYHGELLEVRHQMLAERYPIFIHFYQGEDPVHFAQVDAKGDGSYEYKFRVRNLNLDTGEFVNVFEGDYTVKIYKVIPNTNDLV